MTKFDPTSSALEWLRRGHSADEVQRGLEVHCGITDSVATEAIIACAVETFLAIPEAERRLASPEEQAAKAARKKRRERERADAEHYRLINRAEVREEMRDFLYDAMWALPDKRDDAVLDDLMAELEVRFMKRLGAASFSWAVTMALDKFDREKALRKTEEPDEEKPDELELDRTGAIDLTTWPHSQMQ